MALILLLIAAGFGVAAAATRDVRWLSCGFVAAVLAFAVPALAAMT